MEDLILSKTCQICETKAPEKVKFYHHYGAICCYSCKAFFRRYVRGENNPHLYKCKGNNTCPLTNGRKTCKPCRYQKCLQVGMMPENVLNEEDRKKYSHPKKNRKRSAEEHQNGDCDSSGVPESHGYLVSFLTQEVQRLFLETKVEVSAKSDPGTMNKLVFGHLNKDLWSSEQSIAFIEIMDENEYLMTVFAHKMLLFSSLDISDQNLLLSNNSKFFKEYLITRYLMATDGNDQFSWILRVIEHNEFHLMDFDTVNQQHGFLISHLDPNDLYSYKSDLNVISKYLQYPNSHTSLLCYYLLFNTR